MRSCVKQPKVKLSLHLCLFGSVGILSSGIWIESQKRIKRGQVENFCNSFKDRELFFLHVNTYTADVTECDHLKTRFKCGHKTSGSHYLLKRFGDFKGN